MSRQKMMEVILEGDGGSLSCGCHHGGGEKWIDSGYPEYTTVMDLFWIMRGSEELRKTKVLGLSQWRNGIAIS